MIGSKIAKARKAINISQAQLAQRLFISPQAVGKWERGESIPDIVTFNRLAEILGVDLNYFSENFPSLDNETALRKTTGNTGDTEQTVQEEDGDPDQPEERRMLAEFNGSDLSESDFAGITAHKRTFKGSSLRGSVFSGTDLTGSSFVSSDAGETNFDGADLTDCIFSTTDLTNAHFNKTILVRTEFNKSILEGAIFTDTRLTGVKLTMIDFRKTIFDNCIFEGVDFRYCDLREVRLDGLHFIDVRFQKSVLNETSFKGATLRNVSFRPTYALTNKYYRAIKTICFDGAMMDKLTYAALKGMGASLSKVSFI